jgi:hypothetical protein
MFSFLVKGTNVLDLLTPGTVDKNPIQHTVHNSVEEAAIKPEENYEFFTYRAKKPVMVDFRGKPVKIERGMKFGVRPSANKKNIRLIFPGDKTRVITLTQEQANQLAKGV